MKKVVMGVCLCVVLLLTACSIFPNPEKTVSLYLDSAKVLDFATMETLVTSKESKEQLTKMLDTTVNEGAKLFMSYIEKCASKIDYMIVDSKLEEETATVKVLCKYVDGTPLMKEVLAAVLKETFANAFSGKELTEEENEQMYIDAINNALPNIEETIIEQTIDVKLTKAEDGWLIDGSEDELYNVAVANFVNFGNELNKSFQD